MVGLLGVKGRTHNADLNFSRVQQFNQGEGVSLVDFKAHLGIFFMVIQHPALQQCRTGGGHRSDAQGAPDAQGEILQFPPGGLAKAEHLLCAPVQGFAGLGQGHSAGAPPQQGSA